MVLMGRFWVKGKILSIAPDGSESIREVEGEPTLEILQEAIGGGLIEVVPGFTSYRPDDRSGRIVTCVAFCDEEGKIEGQTINSKATMHWQRALMTGGHPGLIGPSGQLVDHLVGKIAIVWGDAAFMRAL